MYQGSDRRCYSRMKLGTKAAIFGGTPRKEIPVRVHDISECGICFEVPNEYRELIKTGDKLEFQFVDVYKYGSSFKAEVIIDECIVKHIDEYKRKGCFCVGCEVRSNKFSEFAVRRQWVAQFEILEKRRGRTVNNSVRNIELQ